MSIETVEELRERLDEAQASLDRAEEEAAKIQRLHAGIPDDDEEQPEYELVNPGIDDFKVDNKGGIWIGNERVGGADVVVEDVNPNPLGLSPAALQSIGIRTRDEAGRFASTVAPEPEAPLWTTPCEVCSTCTDMTKVNPTGVAFDRSTDQPYILHSCRCGADRYTESDGVSDEIQRKALFESEVLAEILEHHMERPPKW